MSEEKLRADFESYLRGGEPDVIEMAMAPVLAGWDVVVTTAPNGDRCMILTGSLTGHPSLPVGKFTRTSSVVWLDRKHRWARTRSRVYRLEGAAP